MEDSNGSECTRIAYRHVLANLRRRLGYAQGFPQWESALPISIEENCRSPLIARKKSRILCPPENRFFTGNSQIAAATAENRTILVRSVLDGEQMGSPSDVRAY